jgi:hypothetical protein
MSLDDAVGTVSGKVTSTSGDVVDTFTLFGERVNGGPDFHFGKVKIYSFKCGSSIDLIPVRVGMEGAMKDKITGKIYRNAGTGAFKIGADRKETPLMCNSYVKDGLVAMWDGVENAGWGNA